ncbi:MAG TPA: serine/threonine-protein kinase [Gemmatales bacterium]|nr:serine/threonine-protein kinase [Gemmatales bacterium]
MDSKSSKFRTLFNESKSKKQSRKMAAIKSFEIKVGAHPKPGYSLTRRLGVGAFGEVWEAVNEDGSKVAMKFIHSKKNTTESTTNEVRQFMMLRQMSHPHVLTLIDVICIADLIVLIMELAKGSLHDLHEFYMKEQSTHISLGTLVDLIEEAACGLDFLASLKLPSTQLTQSGFQHCDVKPSNLLLVGKTVKVADFGIAGRLGLQTGTFMGTPYFAPPELYLGQPSARTDQFSLAVTYCHLRSGKYPFPDSNGKPPEGYPELERYPSKEREVLARALQLNWIDRYPTCTEFIQQLRQATGK